MSEETTAKKLKRILQKIADIAEDHNEKIRELESRVSSLEESQKDREGEG